jgi:hypothetical protein
VLFGGILALMSVLALGFTGWAMAGVALLMKPRQAAKTIQNTNQLSRAKPKAPTPATRGTAHLQKQAQMWQLAPLSTPAGVERGGGDRGGIQANAKTNQSLSIK